MTIKAKIAGISLASALLISCGEPTSHEANKASMMFEQAVSSPTVPGISVALAGQDGIIWAAGFGYADLEHQVPMSTNTKMRIGSVAKPMAAAAMMRLVEQGKVDLDVPVRTYVPEWPEMHADFTLRHIATHTSGIRHYEGDEFLINTKYDSQVDALEVFKDSPLKFAPGEAFSYSTHAWTLLVAALEAADGRDFDGIMNDEVFGQLKLNDSALDDQFKIIPNRQRPYEVGPDGALTNAPQTDHSWKWAGGGIIASPRDVARFAVAHTKGEFLDSDTVAEMFTNAKLNSGDEIDNGISWVIGSSPSIKEVLGSNPEIAKILEDHPNTVLHSGGSMGGVTLMVLCLDHNRAVTVVKNVSGDSSANIRLLAFRTLDLFHKE